MIKVFTNDQMTNDEYHDRNSWTFDYVSGSSLCDIFNTCLAAWRFKETNETSKALAFGTQSHTNFESKELFEREYRRAPKADEYKDAITSQTALAAKLKSFGLKGTSGKQYPELLKMMSDFDIDLNVMYLIDMIAQSQAAADGVELVPADDYDACVRMRQVLEGIPAHNACMNSETAQREISIFGEIMGVKVKVRLDHLDFVRDVTIRKCTGIDEFGDKVYEEITYPLAIVITDYKTTQSANPKEFPRLAYNHGYYMKMALQHDLLVRAIRDGAFVGEFPEDIPVIVRLLAQEKKEPFLPLAYRLTDEQIAIGRRQYKEVIFEFAQAVSNDVWPSYENNASEIELETPQFVKYQYQELFN